MGRRTSSLTLCIAWNWIEWKGSCKRVYEAFSSVYDDLMRDVPYDQFAALFERATEYVGSSFTRVIDLGCGTGVMIPHLLRRSRTVIGVDPSAEMLAVAAQKVGNYRQRVSFVQATAATLPSEGVQAEFCVSFCDVLNYVLTEEEFLASFRSIARALSKNGHFLFDLHSPYKILHVLGNQVHYDISDHQAALMTTSVDETRLLVAYDLTVFDKAKNGLYRRFDEHHEQRAYSLFTVLRALFEAGFRSVHLGADGSLFMHVPPVNLSLFATDTENEQKKEIQSLEQQFQLESAQRWFFFAHRENGEV